VICVRIRVSGRVQGVSFRTYTKSKAEELGVKGWVQNLPGGGLEAVLEGDRKNVGGLLSLMKMGPAGSMVSGMELSEIKCKNYADFKILY
jgi:acylphosphatase